MASNVATRYKSIVTHDYHMNTLLMWGLRFIKRHSRRPPHKRWDPRIGVKVKLDKAGCHDDDSKQNSKHSSGLSVAPRSLPLLFREPQAKNTKLVKNEGEVKTAPGAWNVILYISIRPSTARLHSDTVSQRAEPQVQSMVLSSANANPNPHS